MLSGAEDLVSVFVEMNGQWQPESLHPQALNGKEYYVRRYRPRIEGLFARIERWIDLNDRTDTFWRSISKDNINTMARKTVESRIADLSKL